MRRVLSYSSILLILLLTAGYFTGFFKAANESCPTVESPVSSGKIEFLKGRSPLDTSVQTLHKTPYFILAYMTAVNSSYQSTPVYFYPLKENRIQENNVQFFGESEHVRHFVKVNTPWGEGALLADHGKDGGTFDGGNVLLVVSENNRLSDKSAALKQSRNFVFNVAAVTTQSSAQDLLLVPFNGPKSKVVYLSAMENGYKENSALLPAEWTDFNVCFMTAMPFDIDNDGLDEIALGACDLRADQNPQARDRMLVFKKGRWNFAPDMFPLRKMDPTWGTVFWHKEGNELIALTHNKGFTQADIQFFTYDQNQHKFIESPVALKTESEPHYFHKIVKFRDRYLTLIRYANPVNNLPGLKALKRQPDGKWEETDVCLALPGREKVLGMDVFESEKGKRQLLLTYYSGRYEVYE